MKNLTLQDQLVYEVSQRNFEGIKQVFDEDGIPVNKASIRAFIKAMDLFSNPIPEDSGSSWRTKNGEKYRTQLVSPIDEHRHTLGQYKTLHECVIAQTIAAQVLDDVQAQLDYIAYCKKSLGQKD